MGLVLLLLAAMFFLLPVLSVWWVFGFTGLLTCIGAILLTSASWFLAYVCVEAVDHL